MAEPLTSPTKGNISISKDELSRRGLSKSENATAPITPPARYISSNFSTPGSAYGKEEDAIIIELSSRYLKAGIEGESFPQCRYDFKPAAAKRVGDYREWLPGYTPPKENLDDWGRGYELWKSDLKDVDLGLVGNKLERAMREIYNKTLLVDGGNARLVLVIPSLLPHPLLETILRTLFERWNYPSITLLPAPATALVAAGLRSGLVIDLGWEETTVTAVYEYREVRTHRSTRALKLLTKTFAEWAKTRLNPACCLDLETTENFLSRIGSHVFNEQHESLVPESASTETIPDDISLEWPTDAFTHPVVFSRRELKTKLMCTLLGTETELYPDDEELPIQRLMHDLLLSLPPDVRGMCLSRIVFTGEGSEKLRLQALILNAFSRLLDVEAWNEIQGRKVAKVVRAKAQSADVKHDDIIWSEKVAAEERYLREKVKHTQPCIHGVMRQVETLGSWAGASLLTSLKIKSFVEVQRDRFLSHGLSGASKELDVSVVPQQRVSTMGVRPKAGERTSWTLSGWG